MSRAAWMCPECLRTVGWEDIVTRDTGPGHERDGAWHPVVPVPPEPSPQNEIDAGLLYLNVLRSGDGGGTMPLMRETLTGREAVAVFTTGGYVVGAVLLTMLCGITGMTRDEVLDAVQGLLIDSAVGT